MSKLSIEEIKKILPHREPFLMVDRVDELEEGVYAKGVKAVSGNEWFFQGHFADHKVMPGVLIVEAMAQMGGIALLTMEEMKGRLAFLGKIKSARFSEKVVPGDVLMLETRIDTVKGSVGIGSGTATVDGRQVASCELMFAIGDAAD
jgi:3-hydroxyacyl-[acyl-carrier-protein] dehydratase